MGIRIRMVNVQTRVGFFKSVVSILKLSDDSTLHFRTHFGLKINAEIIMATISASNKLYQFAFSLGMPQAKRTAFFWHFHTFQKSS
jgi:hypothetical protein